MERSPRENEHEALIDYDGAVAVLRGILEMVNRVEQLGIEASVSRPWGRLSLGADVARRKIVSLIALLDLMKARLAELFSDPSNVSIFHEVSLDEARKILERLADVGPNDVEYVTPLSREIFVDGVAERSGIAIVDVRTPICPLCGGDGYSWKPSLGDEPCDHCRGTGVRPICATPGCYGKAVHGDEHCAPCRSEKSGHGL